MLVLVLDKHRGSSISDINHFRLAGREVWGRYKDIAATRVIEEQCPRCNCGIVGVPEGNRIECPGCGVIQNYYYCLDLQYTTCFFHVAWLLPSKRLLPRMATGAKSCLPNYQFVCSLK